MKITKAASVGTLESNDISIRIEPNEKKSIEISLESVVEKQYGKQIKKVIMDTLKSLKVEGATINAVDKGALDCVIKARVETAVMRASNGAKFNWGEE